MRNVLWYRLTFFMWVATAAAAFVVGCGPSMPPRETLIPPQGKYDTKILRDTWGVPHVFGKTDADVAYGLGYAHAEDDFETIQDSLLMTRGVRAQYKGRSEAQTDYLIKLFRFNEIVADKYHTDLSEDVRKICEAYADGVNHYAALHPDKVLPGVLPFTGKDVVVGFVAKTPFFFGLERHLRRALETPKNESEEKPSAPPKAGKNESLEAFMRLANWSPWWSPDVEVGSNAFAVAPWRTPDGRTHLAVNSHQPYTGPVAWYEAYLHSEQGWDIVGGVFPGSPVILHGHNRHLGWAHTVNTPDLVDLYEIEVNPDNPNQYRFDGEWRNFDVGTARITVKILGPITWTVERETLYTVYGPALRLPDGRVLALRYSGYGDIRQVEQWYRMNKAQNREQFLDAMRMQAVVSFNCVYADKDGNIGYIYNCKLPLRKEGFPWRGIVPGNTSATLWTEYLPFDRIPMVWNPPSGFVQSCNNTPFFTTTGDANPKEEDYPDVFGIEKRITNRALRAMDLFGSDDSITEEDFQRYKFDTYYSKKSRAFSLGQELVQRLADDPDPLAQKGIELLRNWDLNTDIENRATALAVLTFEPIVRAELFEAAQIPDVVETFKEKIKLLQETYGRIDVPWGQINRFIRGDLNLPIMGGPDTLRAVYGRWENGVLVAHEGDTYIMLVNWDKEGNLHSRNIHQYGSATLDKNSPHYADQVPLYVRCELKPTWMDEAEVRQHLEAEYRPGEPRR